MKTAHFALTAVLALSACSGGEPAPAPAESAAAAGAATAPQPPAGPAVAAIDPAKLADPCLLDAKMVAEAMGFKLTGTEPETMGAMGGCTYKGEDASLRLNFIVHDPVYFDKATAMTRSTRPGDKRDVPGDADRAWIQQDGAVSKPILHYYRQNVEVELIPLGVGGDPKAVEAALLKLPRLP